MKFISLFYVLLFGCSSLAATNTKASKQPSFSILNSPFSIQKDTLPPDAILYQSLEKYYEQKTAAELTEFQENQKGEWLKYLPNLGVSYTFDNKPRPSASISSSTIYNAKKNKQQRAAKRKAIEQVNLLAYQQDRIRLRQLLNQYQLEVAAMAFQVEIFEIDKTLFEIEEAKYNDLEIPPSEFLKIKRAYLVKEFDLEEERKELALLEDAILVAARWMG